MEEEAGQIAATTLNLQNVNLQSVRKGNMEMETLTRSQNETSQKLVQRARHTSVESTKVVKKRKKKVPPTSVEDEALGPSNNRHVCTASTDPIVQSTLDGNMRKTYLSNKAISKKIVDKAISVSREVARVKKTNELMNTEAGSLSPANVGQMDSHSCSPPTETSPIAKKIRRSRSTASEVWNHFHEPDENDNDPVATCKHCGKEYTCKSFHGTSNLWKHLRFQCPVAPLQDQCMKKKEPGTPKQTYNYDECRGALAEMIAIDQMQFRAVEGEGLIRYSYKLQPRFQLPSRTTVARDTMHIFIEEKEKMKQIFKNQRISLTTDTWTSNQNINYMVLAAHWVDDKWKLQRRVINFCSVDDHKGETIGRKIEECLLEWGIDRIFTITVDKASSNNGAINYIKNLSKSCEGTVLRHEFIRMRCCAHIVNLVVKNGLEVTNDSIERIRIAVRFVRSSPARLQQFKKCAAKEKISRKRLLSLDIDTRRNATYLMLENAVIFEKAFARLNKDNQQFRTYFEDKLPPNEDDWCNARRVIQFLKVFYKVTFGLSGCLHVTSSGFFHEFVLMHSKLDELTMNSHSFIVAMSERMKKKFCKYWEDKDDLNNLLFIALILDPRYKVKYLSFCFLGIYGATKTKELVGKIESDLRWLFDCYVESATWASNHYYNQPALLIDVDEHEENPSLLLASQFSMHLEEIESRESNSELSRYLAENCEKITDDLDLLMWWKCNSNKYPILSKLAKDVLAVPVSTVTSESSFSTGGRILDSLRTSLSASMVEALICTQSWLRLLQALSTLEKVWRKFKLTRKLKKKCWQITPKTREPDNLHDNVYSGLMKQPVSYRAA